MEKLEIIWGWGYLFLTGLGALHFGVLAIAVVVISTILASAFIAATIAETRGHTMLKHFLAGLLLPILYPIIINKNLPHLARERKNKKSELASEVQSEINMKMAKVQYQLECKKRAKKGLSTPDFIDWFNERKNAKIVAVPEKISAEEVSEKSNTEQSASINRDLLENLAVDNSGNRQGPFQVVLADGRELIAKQIRNISDEIATFEISDDQGATKNIRLKYTNIVTLKTLNQ